MRVKATAGERGGAIDREKRRVGVECDKGKK